MLWRKLRGNPNFKKNYVSLTAIILILLIVSSLSFLYSNNIINTNILSYSEKGNIDYKVFLKENNFYVQKYLTGSNRKYIAALINNIELNFNYDMSYEKNVNYKYEYYIDATLNIAQPDDKQKIYYTDTQRLLDLKKNEGTGDKFTINEKLDVDYNKYNELVKSFSNTYSISPACYIKIELVVNVSGSYDENIKDISKKSAVSIEIPFYEKAINMGTDNTSISNNGTYLEKEKYELKRKIWNTTATVLLVVAALLLAYLIIIIVKDINKKLTKYQRALKKIFKKYDQIIVMAYGDVKLSSEKAIEVGKFEELVDVSELVNQPIKCYTSDTGAVFVLNNGESEVYVFKIKKDLKDLEKQPETQAEKLSVEPENQPEVQAEEPSVELENQPESQAEEPNVEPENQPEVQAEEPSVELENQPEAQAEELSVEPENQPEVDLMEVAGGHDEINKLSEELIEELDKQIEENLNNTGENNDEK